MVKSTEGLEIYLNKTRQQEIHYMLEPESYSFNPLALEMDI